MSRPPTFTFRLDPQLRNQLEHLAKADKRTLAAYIKIVLEEHVESARKVGKLPKKIAVENRKRSIAHAARYTLFIRHGRTARNEATPDDDPFATGHSGSRRDGSDRRSPQPFEPH